MWRKLVPLARRHAIQAEVAALVLLHVGSDEGRQQPVVLSVASAQTEAQCVYADCVELSATRSAASAFGDLRASPPRSLVY
jgi:hypothetical protein